MEKTEDLNLSGLKIYQDEELYKFTSDSVLLTRFASVKKGDVVADFCSGSGIVGFHLYGLNPVIKSVTFFEMQKPLYELSVKSIKLNNLEDKFNAVNCRVQDIDNTFNEKFSLIVCNPPYQKANTGDTNDKENISVCRCETALPLTDLIRAISKALKFHGRVNFIHRADRLADVIYEMKKANIEPKKLQFVAAKGKEPYAFMIEGVKGGNSGIKLYNTVYN